MATEEVKKKKVGVYLGVWEIWGYRKSKAKGFFVIMINRTDVLRLLVQNNQQNLFPFSILFYFTFFWLSYDL